jgi:hypothetical protein
MRIIATKQNMLFTVLKVFHVTATETKSKKEELPSTRATQRLTVGSVNQS